MAEWERVTLPPATVAGEGTHHRREDLGSTPIKTTEYARQCGAVAHRDGENVQVYLRDANGTQR